MPLVPSSILSSFLHAARGDGGRVVDASLPENGGEKRRAGAGMHWELELATGNSCTLETIRWWNVASIHCCQWPAWPMANGLAETRAAKRRAGAGGTAAARPPRLASLPATEKEIDRVHAGDAVFRGGRRRIERDDGLRVVVAQALQGLEFPLQDAGAAERLRDLDVGREPAAAGDEVDLERVALADAHARVAADEFVEDNVFKKMPLVAGPVPDEDVPQPRVDGVELLPQQIEKIGSFDHGLSPLDESAVYCRNRRMSRCFCISLQIHVEPLSPSAPGNVFHDKFGIRFEICRKLYPLVSHVSNEIFQAPDAAARRPAKPDPLAATPQLPLSA